MGLLAILRRALSAAPQTPQRLPKAPRVKGALTTTSPRQITPTRGYYEALNESPDRTPIPRYSFAVRQLVRGASRQNLALLGRYLADNEGLAGYAVEQIANYSVPVIPQAASPDSEWNKLADDWFATWAKRADFTGRFNFDALQRLACKALDTDGDLGILATDQHGFPQIALLETWQIDSTTVTEKNVLHNDGVQIDKDGAVIAYYVRGADASIPAVPVPVDQVLLLYDAERYSDYRGYSPLRRGSNDLRDNRDIRGFEKLATKINSALAGAIQSEGGVEEDVWGNDTGDVDGANPGNQPPADATAQEKKLTLVDLLGGDLLVLEPGQQLNATTNERPGARIIELLEYLGGCFVSGLGIPPAFFIDAKLTGPNQRSVNGKAQRKFDKRQELIARMVEWVWLRVIAWAIANGELPAAEGWDRIEWQGPPKVSIDEGKDSQQWREDLAKGLMTRQNHFANRQLNWRRETDQSLEEDRYIIGGCKSLASETGVPVEALLARYGYDAAKPAPPPPGPEDEAARKEDEVNPDAPPPEDK